MRIYLSAYRSAGSESETAARSPSGGLTGGEPAPAIAGSGLSRRRSPTRPSWAQPNPQPIQTKPATEMQRNGTVQLGWLASAAAPMMLKAELRHARRHGRAIARGLGVAPLGRAHEARAQAQQPLRHRLGVGEGETRVQRQDREICGNEFADSEPVQPPLGQPRHKEDGARAEPRGKAAEQDQDQGLLMAQQQEPSALASAMRASGEKKH